MDEKRKFLRFDTAFNIEFKPSDNAEGKYRPGLLKSFSREGLSFLSQDFNIASQKDLELRIKLPVKDIIISCSGEVMWKKTVENQIMVGMRLNDIAAAEKGEILEYVYEKWVDKANTRK